jgi:hypothetical protein
MLHLRKDLLIIRSSDILPQRGLHTTPHILKNRSIKALEKPSNFYYYLRDTQIIEKKRLSQKNLSQKPIKELYSDFSVSLVNFHLLCDKILIMLSLLIHFSFIFSVLLVFLKNSHSESILVILNAVNYLHY